MVTRRAQRLQIADLMRRGGFFCSRLVLAFDLLGFSVVPLRHIQQL